MKTTIKCPLCERDLPITAHIKEAEFSRSGRVLIEFTPARADHNCAGTPDPGPMAA